MSKISVFGLGYVGTVTAACLAMNKHQVTGVDVAQEKIDLINAGRSPIIERDIDDIVAEGVGTRKWGGPSLLRRLTLVIAS